MLGLTLAWCPQRGAVADNPVSAKAASGNNEAIAASLAEMLRDARAVVSNNEDLINDPTRGDKQLTAMKVKTKRLLFIVKIRGLIPPRLIRIHAKAA